MKVNMFRKLVLGLTVMSGLAIPPILLSADTPAFVLGDVLQTQPWSFTGSRGWQFQPAGDGVEIFITQLGVFDDGGDGLVNSHEIGLWRNDPGNLTGTQLASAIVPAGTDAPLLGGYRWVAISPVIIPFDLASYVVAAQYSADDADDLVTPRPSGTLGNFQFAPHIGVFTGAGRAALGEDLSYPVAFSSCGEGCTPEIYWEPNLQYSLVPEPASWVLLVPGFVLLLRRCMKTR